MMVGRNSIETTAIIRNPADLDKFWEGAFLVDAGAIDCVVPRAVLEGVGLRPKGERVYTMADSGEKSRRAMSKSWAR